MNNIALLLKKIMNVHDPMTYRFNDEIHFYLDGKRFTGDLVIPADATGIVIFCDGLGGGHSSVQNIEIAKHLNELHIGTFVLDRDSGDEPFQQHGAPGVQYLVKQLSTVTKWIHSFALTQDLKVGYFSTGNWAAASLVIAAEGVSGIETIVCFNGRPDLAGEELRKVPVPVLLIANINDQKEINWNRKAKAELHCDVKLIQMGEENFSVRSGKLTHVASMIGEWFHQYFSPNTISSCVDDGVLIEEV